MNFIINGAFKDDTSNPSSPPSLFCRPHQSFLQHENGFTRILGIKKEPNGSDVKNIK